MTDVVISHAWPITVDVDAVPERWRSVFVAAAEAWGRVIVGPRHVHRGMLGTHIVATVGPIDGPGGVLGRAEPTELRTGAGAALPAAGVMRFDAADMGRAQDTGTLDAIVTHEMGHVLGFGTLWDRKQLVKGERSPNPTFTGAQATAEWLRLVGSDALPGGVPIENAGGDGVRLAHWRESVFADEVMSSLLTDRDVGARLSRLTVASMADLGYVVDIDAAAHVCLPSPLTANLVGAGADRAGWPWRCCGGTV